ncbi:hypothetical protein [Bradyrhizobium betae]|nr:hypothetical protein [Bradyrhizobium betae]
MKGPRLKVERANEHLNALISFSSPLSKELHEVSIGRPTGMPGKPRDFMGWDVAYRPKRPISEFFALIIGDTVHNLRTALDHWAMGVVGAATGNARDRSIYFPFAGRGKQLETTSAYIAIQKAVPDAAEFIRDKIKPYEDGDSGIWPITELDNIDKHNFILPVVSFSTISRGKIRIANGNVLEGNLLQNDANRWQGIALFDRPPVIEEDFEVSVELTFPKGGLFEDKGVIPTLRNLSNLVSGGLDALEEFLRTRAR